MEQIMIVNPYGNDRVSGEEAFIGFVISAMIAVVALLAYLYGGNVV
jgi:hypothetical protein